MAEILGSSGSTKYQITKYFNNIGIEDKDSYVDSFIKYSVLYGVNCDLGISIALAYTDNFSKEVIGNNICGIGLQFGLDNLETFESVDACIAAEFELIRAGADFQYSTDRPASFTLEHFLKDHAYGTGKTPRVGSITTISDICLVWGIYGDSYGNKTIEDIWKVTRDIPRIKEVKPVYQNPRNVYFFAVVTVSHLMRPLLKHKGYLTRHGFGDVSIRVDKGFYQLEVGRFKNEKDVLPVKQRLAIYGYSATISSREREDITETTQ